MAVAPPLVKVYNCAPRAEQRALNELASARRAGTAEIPVAVLDLVFIQFAPTWFITRRNAWRYAYGIVFVNRTIDGQTVLFARTNAPYVVQLVACQNNQTCFDIPRNCAHEKPPYLPPF